jgi:hypothetical protein
LFAAEVVDEPVEEGNFTDVCLIVCCVILFRVGMFQLATESVHKIEVAVIVIDLTLILN